MFKLEYEKTFDASHFLPNYDGPCCNVHGHTWRVKIGVRGGDEVDAKSGMIVDFAELKKIIMQYDHKSINDFIGNPTAEIIAYNIYQETRRKLRRKSMKIDVDFVEVWEGPGSMVRFSDDS